MMFLYLKNKILFVLFFCLLIVSCNYKRDPALPYNNKFLKKYGKQLEKAKRRHKNIARQNNIFYDENLDRIANLKDNKSDEIRKERNKEFLEQYINAYAEKERKEVSYLDKNHDAFILPSEKNRKDYDKFIYFKKDYLKNKNYHSIDYSIVQVNYDYIQIIKQIQYDEYLNELEVEKAKEKAIEEQKKNAEEKPNTFKKIGSSITDAFKNLFKMK